jgi:5'-3' exonuclease
MGIPSYFRKIVKEYPDSYFWDSDLNVDHFFIDFNAMIYYVLYKIKKVNEMQPIEFENKLINNVISHMEHVICDVIKPNLSLYIAMDGVPPRAKMIQ